MTTQGLLPIGSVVLLKNSTKRIMIIGVCQGMKTEEGTRLYDYAGCIYPEGYISGDKNFLFNHEQIERLYALGYQDEEQFAFKEKADQIIEELRKKEANGEI